MNASTTRSKCVMALRRTCHKEYASVIMQTPSDVHLIADLKLNHQEIDGGHYVIFDNKKQLYYCYFAPSKMGKHKITIYGKQEQGDTDSGSYSRVLELTLNVKQMPSNPISFPKTWKNFFDLGLEVISPQNTHLIRLNNGTTHTQIQIKTPDNVQLLGSLESEQGEKVIGGNQVYYDREKNIWRCNSAPDQSGFFDAMIFAKKKSDPGNYAPAVSFKIEAKKIPSPSLSYSYAWQLFYDLGLKIEAPKNRSNAIWPDNASYAEVLIQAPDDVTLSSSIVYNNINIENGSLAQYNHEKQYWQLLFTPERNGPHELIVYAKRTGGNESSVVKFNLNVTKLQRPMKFPLISSHFKTKKCRIYTPIDGILKKGSIVPIHYVIPGAIDVDLLVNSKCLNIEGYKDSILQRQITVGSKEVIIYAKYGEKSNYNPLFKYTVQ